MNEKDTKRPPDGSPELEQWLKERAKKRMNSIFGENYQPASFNESGPIFGKAENLYKTDAELFPDELEEYTPEERRGEAFSKFIQTIKRLIIKILLASRQPITPLALFIWISSIIRFKHCR